MREPGIRDQDQSSEQAHLVWLLIADRSSPIMGAESGDRADDLLDLVRGDEARALELPRRVLVARAGEEIVTVVMRLDVVPAAVADVIIDHAVGRGKFGD